MIDCIGGFLIQNGRNISSASRELKVLELGTRAGGAAHRMLPAPPVQRSARNLDKAEKQISDTRIGVPMSAFILVPVSAAGMQ